MIYPLSWLSEYAKLPVSTDLLTGRLTMIGHLLDKKKNDGGEEIIDLELRGNRPDLLGIYGMAREISAAFSTSLAPLKVTPLPAVDLKNDLVVIKDPDLVERFQAITLKVKVKSSPSWLKLRLSYFGVPAVNNVVDITNYVMLETGEPMHAYDLNRLTGKRLILRRARSGELLTTLQGTVVKLESEDLVISDLKKPQGLTMIGSQDSGTNFETSEILLEAAVYKYANVRHTGRRLGIHTEAGTRHEKILDPNNVELALERALFLLTELASAQPTSKTFDFYPNNKPPTRILISTTDVEKLFGVNVSANEIANILKRLGCEIDNQKGETLSVLTPTFRTDLEQTADLVEEVARISGYEKIPTRNFSQLLTTQQTYPGVIFEDKLRDSLVNLGFKETITLSFLPNSDVSTFSLGGQYPEQIKIINPPDPEIATLRPSLIPTLVRTAQKAANFKQQNLNYFELGKVFFKNRKKENVEQNRVALIKPIMRGSQLSYSNAIGYLKAFLDDLGIDFSLVKTSDIPSFEAEVVTEILNSNKKSIGFAGLLNSEIRDSLKLTSDFLICELNIEQLMLSVNKSSKPYFLYPPYPGLYEDITLEVGKDSELGKFKDEAQKISPLIKEIKLIDTFGKTRTFRITYQDPKKSVASTEIKPLRDKIIKLAEGKYQLKIK